MSDFVFFVTWPSRWSTCCHSLRPSVCVCEDGQIRIVQLHRVIQRSLLFALFALQDVASWFVHEKIKEAIRALDTHTTGEGGKEASEGEEKGSEPFFFIPSHGEASWSYGVWIKQDRIKRYKEVSVITDTHTIVNKISFFIVIIIICFGLHDLCDPWLSVLLSEERGKRGTLLADIIMGSRSRKREVTWTKQARYFSFFIQWKGGGRNEGGEVKW